MPITSLSGDQTAPNTWVSTAWLLLMVLRDCMDWETFWTGMQHGVPGHRHTCREGLQNHTKTHTKQWRNEQQAHTRVQTAFSLIENCRNITFPWGFAVK